MAAADRDGVTYWYDCCASNNDVDPRLQQRQDREEDEYEMKEEEEEEVEECVDDEPMHITGRLFLGSIDAARNVTALKRLRISTTLALLGKGEEVAVLSRSTSVLAIEYTEQQITRTLVEIEDSKDGNLLRRIPGILATLGKIIIAGRSRSASVVAAWMLVSEPKLPSVQDVVDRIRIIRPWIEINAHFMQDLHLFHAVLGSTDRATLSVEMALLLTDRSFPRLDFGANLVDGIVQGTKTITMRLLSDIESDQHSDLGDIFPYSVVTATTVSPCTNSTPRRMQFAYLLIDQIDIQDLRDIDQAILHKTGFDSTDEVLAVLKQYYPNVTTATSLLMLHFHYLCPGVAK
ncbi:hypothetical protein KXD40_005066 [Peronospora effusa]|uniref:protein-tyrosine-phosphatase n=1 Tax=Peronospora effusa TaxID=542832 RepID=A0A3M6VLM9_9STRA|nr:hypothetical protein DD238_002707 [Peronospora effusa]RQM16862.1 hypothetical protein DD237_003440 [Peronospora effusa]UIZ22084.1 hypothetical protein KXD40_005066 [Peronospora effusa]CAI5710269.1 unnamed protein product [Peronospora effusa]